MKKVKLRLQLVVNPTWKNQWLSWNEVSCDAHKNDKYKAKLHILSELFLELLQRNLVNKLYQQAIQLENLLK
jgi:hypothetical protein